MFCHTLCQAVFLFILMELHVASCDTFHIVASPTSPCPREFTGVRCLSLQQYAYTPSRNENITLIFEPGMYSLSTVLQVSNGYNFTMSSTSATVMCTTSAARFSFNRVRNVHISGMTFQDCLNTAIRLTNIENVSFRLTAFQRCRNTALYMSSVTRASIMDCSFTHTSPIYYYYSGNQGGSISLYSSSLQIINCVFQDNRASYGGVIYASSSTFTIERSLFNNSFASNNGGAIYSTGCSFCRGNIIQIDQTNFISNTASTFGGAVYVTGNNGAVSVTHSLFTTNTANSFGGAVYLSGTNISLSVTNSTFVKNTAVQAGGAIYIDSRYANVTLTSSTFTHNSASYCGVLDVDDFDHFSVNFTDSIFTHNRATGHIIGGGVACIRNASINILNSSFKHNSANYHAGVFYIDESVTTVDGSLFINNSAALDGGVLYTYIHASDYFITGSQFSKNTAGDNGGVILIGPLNSVLTFDELIFNFNSAGDRGGVVALVSSSTHMEINRTNIYNNTAQFGGVISACNSQVTLLGNDLFSTVDPVLSFCTLYEGDVRHHNITPPEDPEVAMTTAPPTTSATFHIVTSPSSPCPGEFIGVPCLTLQQYVSNPSHSEIITLMVDQGTYDLSTVLEVTNGHNFTMSSTNATVVCTTRDARLTFNRVENVHISGITFQRCQIGAIDMSSVTRARIVDTNFVQNFYQYVYYVPYHVYTYHSGASISLYRSFLHMINCVFEDNVGNNGGAIYASSSTIRIERSLFNNNYAWSGGAIYSTGCYGSYCSESDHLGDIILSNTTFYNNSEGALYISGGRLSVAECHFDNNTAQCNGGAIQYYTGCYGSHCSDHPNDIILNSTTFYNNSGRNGGALYMSGQETSLSLVECHFDNNIAQQSGGAIYKVYGTNDMVTMDQVVFTNNQATSFGGAVYVSGINNSLSVTGSTVFNNTAVQAGGGAVYIDSRYANVTLASSTFKYNSASYCGVLDIDDIDHFSVDLTNSIFTHNRATGQTIGGGVACIRNASINIIDSSFKHNSANYHAGVFYIDESVTTVDGSLFINNSAAGDGGVFYTHIHTSDYFIMGSHFSKNMAGDDGGVILIGHLNCFLTFDESIFNFNSAGDRGGVVALVSSSTHMEINRTNIYNNTAQFGGVISACNSQVTLLGEGLFSTVDPVLSFCTLYEGDVQHHNITPPEDPEVAMTTMAPPTTESPITITRTSTPTNMSVLNTTSTPVETNSTSTMELPVTNATSNEEPTAIPTFNPNNTTTVGSTNTAASTTIIPPTVATQETIDREGPGHTLILVAITTVLSTISVITFCVFGVALLVLCFSFKKRTKPKKSDDLPTELGNFSMVGSKVSAFQPNIYNSPIYNPAYNEELY